ncbi:hypothetical protein PJ311_18440 [Bacillus sp. CLL-7-23]|uniref:Uncharacterized protein n=1 Tax=Bacillus changyiensis TaxID=3004103 RepID=A0ABT4XAS9_9BACI|nr:hypothetical protein [Bacillus changyiensis]MDA1477271.1 hypothetical protein [Bacillus changyiensis]MDA7028521.1 hypothetical protein [Bacillus changyiensis]
MPYITLDYYNNDYKGTQAPVDDIEKYIERASDVIDQVTGYKLYGKNLSNLPPLMQDLVKKATAAQVEFYVIKGGDASVNAGTDDLTSVSVGSFSYSEGTSSGGGSNRDEKRVSPSTLAFLKGTGLLYGGVCARG